MASSIDIMAKSKTPSSGSTSRTSPERRAARRCKITQLMRIRPSDPEQEHFEDIRGTMSVSRTGVFFHSSEPGYKVGMRLFVTMPYSKEPASMSREYLAEVVRRDNLPNGLFGVGIKILMEMGLEGGYGATNWSQRK
jgi:PilZ domain